jgi:hypothetical protein
MGGINTAEEFASIAQLSPSLKIFDVRAVPQLTELPFRLSLANPSHTDRFIFELTAEEVAGVPVGPDRVKAIEALVYSKIYLSLEGSTNFQIRAC